MLCVSPPQSQGHSSPAALDMASPASPSMLCAREGREAFSHNLKSGGTCVVPDKSPHSGDGSATAGSTDAGTRDGSDCFACLRHSFHRRLSADETAAAAQQLTTPTTKYEQLICELAMWERESRQQLVRHEQEELMQMVLSEEKTLFPVMAALRDANTLSLMQEEAVWRWGIQKNYHHFLRDVMQVLEVLHRRSLAFAEEPRCRKQIENSEGQHWIAARRRQVMRETQEAAAAEKEDREMRLAYFAHIQQQLYQIFLVEESERDDRMEVERLQRLYAGSLVAAMAKEYRHARLCQLKYEARRFELQPEVTRDLIADEALHRSWLCQDQALGFKKMQADEIRSYLASARQELLNQRVEED